MKKSSLLILVLVLGFVIWKKDDISQYVVQKIIFKDQYQISDSNPYYKQEQFNLFQNINDFTIDSKDDFNNFLYTVLNSGWDSFSFFCDFKYDNCVNDFTEYIKTSEYVEAINNYVAPFNSFESLSVSINNFNKITIDVEKLYTDEQIISVNLILDQFIKNNITDNMTDTKKIKLFHDWLIKNTTYDTNFDVNTDKDLYPYHPYNAYGALIEGKAVCSGYSDAMAIYLNKLGIKNYKISNDAKNNEDGHVWNYAFVDNKWYHLDLTWDDPIKSNIVIYDFFLITTDELKKIDTDKHSFNKNYYPETKNS